MSMTSFIEAANSEAGCESGLAAIASPASAHSSPSSWPARFSAAMAASMSAPAVRNSTHARTSERKSGAARSACGEPRKRERSSAVPSALAWFMMTILRSSNRETAIANVKPSRSASSPSVAACSALACDFSVSCTRSKRCLPMRYPISIAIMNIANVRTSSSGRPSSKKTGLLAIHLVPRLGHPNGKLDDIRVEVRALVEDPRAVDRHAQDVVALGDAGDVDPLARELLVVPVAPAARDALVVAVVPVARVVAVLERVLEAESLLLAGNHCRAIGCDELVNGEVTDVVVAVAAGVVEPRRVGVARIRSIAEHEIAVAAVHDDRVEAQEAPIPGAADRELVEDARVVHEIEVPIDDLQLIREPLEIDGEIGLPAIVVDRVGAAFRAPGEGASGQRERDECGDELGHVGLPNERPTLPEALSDRSAWSAASHAARGRWRPSTGGSRCRSHPSRRPRRHSRARRAHRPGARRAP